MAQGRKSKQVSGGTRVSSSSSDCPRPGGVPLRHSQGKAQPGFAPGPLLPPEEASAEGFVRVQLKPASLSPCPMGPRCPTSNSREKEET